MTSPNTTGHPDLHVIDINGKKLVSGLYWKPLRSVRSYMAEAKEIGKQENMEMVTIRKGRTVIQAGFAPKGLQRLKGMYSLAAALAGQLGENWVGCFELGPDRYALVAVYKGAVAPGFDVVGSRDVIEPKLREVYSLLASNPQDDFDGRVIAPAEFEFGNESLELAELLTAKAIKKEHRLRPLTFGLTPRQFAAIGVGVAVLAAAGYGVNWWIEDQRQQEQRAAAIAAARAQLQHDAATEAGIVLPWTTLPDANTLLAACAGFLDATPLSIGGWLFNDARCAPGKAVATFRRQDGSAPVATFVAAVNHAVGRPPGLFDQGTVGAIETAVVVAPRTDDKLRNTAQALLELTSHIQAVGDVATLTLSEKPFTPDPANPEAVAPEWTTNSFVIQTKLPPEKLFQGIDTNGVRVMEVVTTLTSDSAEINWIINGEIYGR